jgi:hypothetical protein
MWYDPVADTWWTASKTNFTFVVAQAACSGDWRLPTASEWQLAIARGVCAAQDCSGGFVWLSDGTVASDTAVVSAGGSARPFCVED